MTFIPVKRKCNYCRRSYSWNPDVGKVQCPHCRGFPVASKCVLIKRKRK